jgi:hypothetical protein
MSHHRNPKVAGQEAARRALEAAGFERPDFVFTFATVGYDQQALLQAVRQATHGAPLCGCSGVGVIVQGEADFTSFAVAVMVIHSDQLQFSHGIVTGLAEDPARVGREIAEAIQPKLNADTLALFLFPDGTTVNYSQLVTGLEGQLDLDQLLPLLGGTAADNVGQRTYQHYDDQVVSDGVAWALLSGRAHIVWAVSHGCEPIGIEHKVTRCAGNVIHEVDGRPFFDVLKDYLSAQDFEDWMTASPSFPIGIRAPGYMEGYDEYLIRVLMRKDDRTGSIAIPTEVSEGTSIWIMRRDYEKMASGVEQVAADIENQLGGKPAKMVFQFDCSGRGIGFLRKPQIMELLGTLQGRIGSDVPWLGLYTFGEISPVGGQNCFHNYTVVLAAICE